MYKRQQNFEFYGGVKHINYNTGTLQEYFEYTNSYFIFECYVAKLLLVLIF